MHMLHVQVGCSAALFPLLFELDLCITLCKGLLKPEAALNGAQLSAQHPELVPFWARMHPCIHPDRVLMLSAVAVPPRDANHRSQLRMALGVSPGSLVCVLFGHAARSWNLGLIGADGHFVHWDDLIRKSVAVLMLSHSRGLQYFVP